MPNKETEATMAFFTKCLSPHGIQADINDRGRTITNFLQQLKLCNPATYFKKTTPYRLLKMSKNNLQTSSTPSTIS